jgi:DNA helicase-2/ATP-dependent DNA helicase PcrA
MELEVGTLVNHSRFGKGKVVKVEGNGHDKKAEILFAKGDTKKLLLRFAKLEIL